MNAGYVGQVTSHYRHRVHLAKPGDTVLLISWMRSVACLVRLDEVIDVECVVLVETSGGRKTRSWWSGIVGGNIESTSC